jgi:uncharacterized protein YndB with AHSA1/START domain
MHVEYKSDSPVTEAACRKATGKGLKEWFAGLDAKPELNQKRRDAVAWIYESIGTKSSDLWWPTTIWVEYERAHKTVNKKDGRAEGYNICSTKTIAAPVADVYAAWADAAALSQWFGVKVKADVTDGGKWTDGDGNSGEYLRVRGNKDLRFTFNHADAEAPTLVDVTIADKGKGKTGLTLMHQRIQNRPEADGLRNAWSEAFERLKQHLEQ